MTHEQLAAWYKEAIDKGRSHEFALYFVVGMYTKSVAPEARLTDDVRDKAIRLICTGLPGPNVCRMPRCECYEANGKPIVETLWTLFSTCLPQVGAMTLPVMGDATPRVKKAVEDAERICPTESHRYGYMISVAQGLEIELDKREKQLLEAQGQLIERNAQLASAMEYGHKYRLEAALSKREGT